MSLSEIGKIKLYEPVYPEPVEDAPFLILLCLLKDPPDGSQKAFAVPWVYSLTDAPFSEPPRAPDPSALSWTIAGDEDHEYEAPDRSNFYSLAPTATERALGELWDRLQAVSANFHPLTKHFFMKAFQEEGVDEIIGLISCIEATLMLTDERGPDKLKKRYKKLLNADTAYNSLELAYDIRRRYLHALGDQGDTMDWKELAKCRWAVAKAVESTSHPQRRGAARIGRRSSGH